MIDSMRQKLSRYKSREEKFNALREYMQILILKILSNKKYFNKISFLGGTALRILFALKRFSEDLDFSTIDQQTIDFSQLLADLSRELDLMNLAHELRPKEDTVKAVMINFVEILQQTEVSIAREQKLSIKLEIDTNPPHGAEYQTSIVNSDFIFPVRHHTLSSLMAGKIHAVMRRSYVKGRDYYDLIWYLTQKAEPNLTFLNNALRQSGESLDLHANNWRSVLLECIRSKDLEKARKDVVNFLESKADSELINLETFSGLLNR